MYTAPQSLTRHPLRKFYESEAGKKPIPSRPTFTIRPTHTNIATAVSVKPQFHRITFTTEAVKQEQTLADELAELEQRIGKLEASMRTLEPEEFSSPSEVEVRGIILDEICHLARGQPLYPSDIAVKHHINPDLVEKCMDELVSEGKLVNRD